jgi:hypothetical protein
MALFITYPDQEFDVGDDMIVTVHAFYEGEYFDPNSLLLTLGESGRDIGLTKAQTGRYQGVVSIQEGDVDEDGDLWVLTEGSNPGFPFSDSARDDVWINTAASLGFDVDIAMADTMDIFPAPGDDVEFEVVLTYRDSPVDADADTLYVAYVDPAETETELTVTRVGTGQYEGVFTIPASLKESTGYDLWAEAEYTVDSIVLDDATGVDVTVEFYDIWVNVGEVTPAQAAIDLYVLEPSGGPLEGATVTIEWTYQDDAWDDKTGTDSGTTDANGMTSLTLAYIDLGKDAWEVTIEGRATYDGLTQLVEGTIYARDEADLSDLDNEGFDVQLVNWGPYKGGESVTLEHVARFDGEPMESAVVYFYLRDQHTIYRFGSETTNAEGEFDFPLNIPTLEAGEMLAFIQGHYHMEDSTYWEMDWEYVQVGDIDTSSLLDEMIDPASTMSTEPFSAGELIKVVFDNPEADGVKEEAMVIWGLGEIPDWDGLSNLEWESWNPHGGMEFLRVSPATWVDDHYEATFACPSFLNETSNLFMYSFIYLEEEGDAYEGLHTAKLASVSPLPPNPPPTVTITSPTVDQKVGGTIKVKGTSTDDTSVDSVEVSIDGGAWETASGKATWSFEVNTKQLADGNHTVEVRSFDGEKYSDVTSVTFEVDQSVAKKKEDDTPGFAATVMLLAVLAAVLVSRGHLRERRRL